MTGKHGLRALEDRELIVSDESLDVVRGERHLDLRTEKGRCFWHGLAQRKTHRIAYREGRKGS